MIYRLIGWFLKNRRIKKRYTLRAFCKEFGFDPVTISKIERGYYFETAPEDKWSKGLVK